MLAHLRPVCGERKTTPSSSSQVPELTSTEASTGMRIQSSIFSPLHRDDRRRSACGCSGCWRAASGWCGCSCCCWAAGACWREGYAN